jgi:hypothetical protein
MVPIFCEVTVSLVKVTKNLHKYIVFQSLCCISTPMLQNGSYSLAPGRHSGSAFAFIFHKHSKAYRFVLINNCNKDVVDTKINNYCLV